MEPKRTRILLLYIFFLNIADAIFTYFSITNDTAYEINFVVSKLLERGPAQFFCVKIGLITFVLLFTHIRIKAESSRHIYTFTIVAITMLVIVILGLISTLLIFL
jgi:hypothetical protein